MLLFLLTIALDIVFITELIGGMNHGNVMCICDRPTDNPAI